MGGAGLLAGVAKAWIDTAPALDLEQIQTQSQTSCVYDKYGNLITEYKGSENRIYASIDEIPDMLKYAVIAREDTRFYEHQGVDIKRIGGALRNNVTGGRTQGASTITDQLIKLTLLTSEQTYKRKLQEAYLALQLETGRTHQIRVHLAYAGKPVLGDAMYGQGRGKGEKQAQQLLDDARRVQEAGAFAVVLEGIPALLAQKITDTLDIPTIGIGAGAGCDGQVLVYQDMLGMFTDFKPKFVKHFANVGEIMTEAFKTFDQEVKEGVFPAPEHTYKIDEDIIGRLY